MKLCALLFMCFGLCAVAEPELLWPNGTLGATGDELVTDLPRITVYSPNQEKNTGSAVLICPGGGYMGLAVAKSTDFAKWLNTQGVTAVVLEYRMGRGGYRHPIPMLDAQRAMRVIRSRAKELGLKDGRIGIAGFSAGGHLASTVGTHFDRGNPEDKDPINRFSCRPDFMILVYPVIAFGEPHTHKGSQNTLIGRDAPKELVESLSNEKQVTDDTPPTFLFHTYEDKSVPVENSIDFFMALRKAGVPAELHVYEKGAHGIAMARDVPGTREWPTALAGWLANQNLIPSK